jgi:sec-independent protein translocase protein TatC
VSISGIVGLFAGKPHHPIGADGRMALSDHLRELRARVLKMMLVILVGLIVSLFFFDQIFELVLGPYTQAQESLPDSVNTEATIAGAGGPLMLYLKLCGTVSVVLTSPLWLYQIWAFILPGLHPRERKWTRIFAAIAGPLFLAGVLLGYLAYDLLHYAIHCGPMRSRLGNYLRKRHLAHHYGVPERQRDPR